MRRLAGHAHAHSGETDALGEIARVAPAGLVDVVGEDAASRSSSRTRSSRRPRARRSRDTGLPGRGLVAVDLAHDVLDVGLALRAVLGVVPVRFTIGQSRSACRARVVRLHALEQVVHEPQLRAGVAGRVERLVAELDQPLRVGERARLLDVARGGHQEDLGLDVLGLQLAARDLGRVAPEASPTRSRRGRARRATSGSPARAAAGRRASSRRPGSGPSGTGRRGRRRARAASSGSASGCR